MSPDLAIPASPAALRNEGSGFLPLTAKAASFSGIGYASGSGETLCMGQYQGGFALCTVQGGEFLDENFQRFNIEEVNEPRTVFVRYISASSSVDEDKIDVQSTKGGDAPFDQVDDVIVRRVGRSSAFLSAPLELRPVWADSAASRRALGTSPVLYAMKAPNTKLRALQRQRDIAKAVTKSGFNYTFPMGLRLSLSMFSFTVDHPQFAGTYSFICSPAANDCPATRPNEDQIQWGLPLQTLDSLTRIEWEADDSTAKWWLRGIRTTTSIMPAVVVDEILSHDYLPLTGTLAGRTDTVYVHIKRPAGLGPRTDGYPVAFGGQSHSLERIVLDMADRYGMPPDVLMSQAFHESQLVVSPGGLVPNPYSYAYEAYSFDFRYITGDGSGTMEEGNRKLLSGFYPFLQNGLRDAAGAVVTAPRSPEFVPEELTVGLVPVGPLPTRFFQIPAGPNGPPVRWDLRVTEIGQPTREYFRIPPLYATLLPEFSFSADCRTGQIEIHTLSAFDATKLQVTYRPSRATHRTGGEIPEKFGAATSVALSTSEIRGGCPTCVLLPPMNPHTSISEWITAKSPGTALKYGLPRYEQNWTRDEAWVLMKEDPSFDIQAQWYGGASFGLLQVWPEFAATTMRAIKRADPIEWARLETVYKPVEHPATRLFDPWIGMEFGAAGVSIPTVSDEGAKAHSWEPNCAAPHANGYLNSCTWWRLWARRLTRFNSGDEDRSDAYTKYANPILSKAKEDFWPRGQ